MEWGIMGYRPSLRETSRKTLRGVEGSGGGISSVCRLSSAICTFDVEVTLRTVLLMNHFTTSVTSDLDVWVDKLKHGSPSFLRLVCWQTENDEQSSVKFWHRSFFFSFGSPHTWTAGVLVCGGRFWSVKALLARTRCTLTLLDGCKQTKTVKIIREKARIMLWWCRVSSCEPLATSGLGSSSSILLGYMFWAIMIRAKRSDVDSVLALRLQKNRESSEKV